MEECHYQIQEMNHVAITITSDMDKMSLLNSIKQSWLHNHYIWCGEIVNTELKKYNPGGTTITSGVEEKSLPKSRKRIMFV